MKLSFMLIDDSELDCFIARKIITHTDNSLAVSAFQNARNVVVLIKENNAEAADLTVILLDLQMPLMSGFEFIEEFEKLPLAIQQKYIIVILSSTRNSNDIFRVLSYSPVHSLIEKPLTRQKLLQLIIEIKQDLL